MLAPTSCAKTLAAVALVVPLLAAGAAEARRGVKPYYSESYETRGPVRGYEGYVAPDYYCSYSASPIANAASVRAASSAAASSAGAWSRPASNCGPSRRLPSPQVSSRGLSPGSIYPQAHGQPGAGSRQQVPG
jgi:hypothetical protein